MKVIIFAGGFGTRLSEETKYIPKPMVEIGGKPILWHIMKIYSSYGFNDFIICCGYKGQYIKEYFMNYYNKMSDFTVNLKNGEIEIHHSNLEPWKVTLIDTGLDTMTGGRLKRVKDYIGNEPFMLTYGDGVGDIDIDKLVKFHQSRSQLLTLTAVKPQGRFGALSIEPNGIVSNFFEKPKGDGAWINAGFFVCEPEVLDYIKNDSTVWEQEPLRALASEGEMNAYLHEGFWKPMDTLKDKMELEELIKDGEAAWIKWS